MKKNGQIKETKKALIFAFGYQVFTTTWYKGTSTREYNSLVDYSTSTISGDTCTRNIATVT